MRPARRSWRRRLQGVAHAVHGTDALGADLPAQRLDVAVDGPGAGGVRPVPDLGQQLAPGAAPRGACSPGTPGGRSRWASDGRPRCAPCPCAALRVVDLPVSPRRRMPLRGVEAARAARSMRRSSTCTRAASSRMENGLVDVVVGADAQPDQHVGLVVARGQHHHRHRSLGLHAPADLQGRRSPGSMMSGQGGPPPRSTAVGPSPAAAPGSLGTRRVVDRVRPRRRLRPRRQLRLLTVPVHRTEAGPAGDRRPGGPAEAGRRAAARPPPGRTSPSPSPRTSRTVSTNSSASSCCAVSWKPCARNCAS
ncbi:hypothetical protein SHIRM173S_02968 [Streptomyces hirsutus]